MEFYKCRIWARRGVDPVDWSTSQEPASTWRKEGEEIQKGRVPVGGRNFLEEVPDFELADSRRYQFTSNDFGRSLMIPQTQETVRMRV